MIRFLDEASALTMIKELAGRSKRAKIAVAFWGDGATELLGLDRADLDLDVLCNLDSGACNPKEIRRLKERTPVRSHPKLHGKVYLMDNVVVLGSSNASTNGLALELGLGGWCEANVVTDDPTVFQDVSEWFADRKGDSYEITADDIALSERIWSERNKAAPAGRRLSQDLGKAFRESPMHPGWKGVKIAIYTDRDLSDEGENEKAETIAENPALKGYDAYEGWHDAFEENDWIIDLGIYRKRGVFGGYRRVPSSKIKTNLLTFLREEDAISLPGFGDMTMSDTDLELLKRSAVGILRKGRGSFADPAARMVSLEEAITFIDRVE
jgi:phosphatidylserine/phosphatidylglycerophosphate/cardiolipin synthase-like enzyme